jgi:O-6-methylguanine DNA methyltransferase
MPQFFLCHHDIASFWLGLQNDQIIGLELFDTDASIAQRKVKQRWGETAQFHSTASNEIQDLSQRIWSFDATLPVKMMGTPWLTKVWHVARQIPVGSLISYQELATQAGNPAAPRAAATAMRLNPLQIIVPCHRVIRKDQSLGGFTAGIEIKKRLIAFEKNYNA